ncbi:S9 family peptidase [Fretibacter rubidus]|uniref:S9 family peptidase n=1 Tax=Fretibacter rubidus TaxID=570162 RepID=UPI00352A367F
MPYKIDLSQTPPRPEKRPHIIEQLGRKRVDDYYWMKDENWQAVMADPSLLNPDIRTHLEAENAYTKSVLAPLSDLEATIFSEMKGRLESEDSSVPSPDGAYSYYHRYRKGDQHGIYARKSCDPVTRDPFGDEVLLLDADIEAKREINGQTSDFFDLGDTAHSPDHNWYAYSVDRKGSENYEVFITKAGETKPRETGITRSAGGLEWARDNRTIFWVERDENQRPYAVFAKDVMDADDTPRLVYREDDPGFFVSISESDSGRYIEISSHNHTTSEIHRIPSGTPTAAPQCIAARKTGHEYSVSERPDPVTGEETLYIHTNKDGAVDFQIMVADSKNPDIATWKPLIPHQPGQLILGMEAYANHLVYMVREDALPIVYIRDLRSGDTHSIAFDEAAYALGLSGGFEFDTPWLRYSYSSPTTPRQVFDYNMDTREKRLRKTQLIPSGHDASHYKTERFSITVRDGQAVPVTLLYHRDTPPNADSPCLLYGYGSYGITIPAGFSTSRLSLVDRGFVYAIAHIRGSQAKGYQWYLDGKMEKKINTFNDYVDVGRALIAQGKTSEGKIIAHGGSAGGLLVGAAVNQAPEVFAGVIAAVPFVDVLNTMSDDSLPLTPPEWPEWGNPIEDEDAYDRLLSYSPYDQVREKTYPPMLITGGLTDPRVTYWEPAKWAAKLRDHQNGNAPILLKINMDAGHQGQSGRYDSLKEVATEYAFAVSVAAP